MVATTGTGVWGVWGQCCFLVRFSFWSGSGFLRPNITSPTPPLDRPWEGPSCQGRLSPPSPPTSCHRSLMGLITLRYAIEAPA